MSKNHHPELFPEEYFYCVRMKNEVPAEITELMREIKDSPYCYKKVAVLDIGSKHDELVVIEKRRLVGILNQLSESTDPQHLMLRMALRK